ncbi:FadR/GntR family transcriptional regulator [Desulfopila sp. IMCC35008]|uniref:FadR/GntR family transcriptional regulator n=1 Tax=Desulfopila sp. IMCC35008 TaxID=2653858 RepID=UPI0013CF513C|nr:FadR/GntR family transcriptional regulator [Desulfopila sp. IMCC35008]
MTGKRHSEIVSQIEELIRNGQLKTCERLPAERVLAGKFKVSRNTIREAIKALAENGVVISRRGAGTFIAEGALAHMIAGSARKQKRLNDIFEVRKILEPQMAALAAGRITGNQVVELEQVLDKQTEALPISPGNIELDERFHRLIVEATDNQALMNLYETLHDILAESRVRELQSNKRYQASLQSHHQILAALKANSARQAEDSMRAHMDQVEKNLQ